jgi:hypothetical protein
MAAADPLPKLVIEPQRLTPQVLQNLTMPALRLNNLEGGAQNAP